MAKSTTVMLEIEGLDELRRRFEDIPRKIAKGIGAALLDQHRGKSWVREEMVTATQMNTFIRDNMNCRPAPVAPPECAYCGGPWYPDKFHPGCCAECGGPKRHAVGPGEAERRRRHFVDEALAGVARQLGLLGIAAKDTADRMDEYRQVLATTKRRLARGLYPAMLLDNLGIPTRRKHG